MHNPAKTCEQGKTLWLPSVSSSRSLASVTSLRVVQQIRELSYIGEPTKDTVFLPEGRLQAEKKKLTEGTSRISVVYVTFIYIYVTTDASQNVFPRRSRARPRLIAERFSERCTALAPRQKDERFNERTSLLSASWYIHADPQAWSMTDWRSREKTLRRDETGK